jgi:hypothetical protein
MWRWSLGRPTRWRSWEDWLKHNWVHSPGLKSSKRVWQTAKLSKIIYI